VYSYICNLTTGDIQVYYFHNYEHARKLNIYELISGEAVRYKISELVGVVPFSTVYYR
jgi:glutamate formiminotransferase